MNSKDKDQEIKRLNSIIDNLYESRKLAWNQVDKLYEELEHLSILTEAARTEIGILKNPSAIFYPTYRKFEVSKDNDYVPLRHNNKFEIDPIHYPYPIRNISTKQKVNESRNGPYIGISLDGERCMKHEVLYEQWHDDYRKSDNMVIDHKNKNKHDNHKDNLELVSVSLNNENCLTCNGVLLDYKKKLSDSAIKINIYVDTYGNIHHFDNYYYDNDTFYKYLGTDRGYRPLSKTPTNSGTLYVKMKNNQGNRINVPVIEFKKQNNI